MATKHNCPCLARAEDDEEIFTLLARDESAPMLVELWADLWEAETGWPTAKTEEAREIAKTMREWRKKNRPEI